jgi:HK97 family phage portal protein
VFKRVGGRKEGRELATGYPLDEALYNEANLWQSSYEWKEVGMRHLLLRGNFYNEVTRDAMSVRFRILNPDRMRVEETSVGMLRYYYTEPGSGTPDVYEQDEIFHVRTESMNGVIGTSVIESAKNAIGLGSAQETHGAALFKNGGLPAFVIKRPLAAPNWSKTDAPANFRREWRKIVAGPENAGNPPILHDGMEIQPLPVSNTELQWIESQKFSGEQICRFFGVSPWMIGLADQPRNAEEGMIPFMRTVLGPWAGCWESAADLQLVKDNEHYTKVELDALQASSMKLRYEANNIAVQGGWKLVNEVRREEDLPPIEGGDVPRYPLNMQPAGGGPDWNEQGGQPGKGSPVERAEQPPDEEEDDPTASLADAFRPLLRDAAERIAAREINGLRARADKADKDRAKWRAWLGTYYREHEAYAAKAIVPIMASWEAAGQDAIKQDAVMMPLASGTELLAAGDVPAILADWETTRAEQHYRALLTAFGIEDKQDAKN